MFKACFFYILFLPFFGFSQTKTSELFFKKVDLKDGLSSYNIRKIIHDKLSFTWIATQDGLNRFDGNFIEVYNKSNTDINRRLLGNDITDMVEDSARNILWACTSYGGINGINLLEKNVEYSISSVQYPGHLTNQWIRCISLCSSNLWIGSNDGLDVYNPATKQFLKNIEIPFNKTNEIKNFNVDLIHVDQFNRVWVFFSNLGLVIYSGNDYRILNKICLRDFNRSFVKDYKMFNGLIKLADTELLVATHEGFVALKYDATNEVKIMEDSYLNASFGKENIVAIAKDNENNIWFSTNCKLLKSAGDQKNIREIVPVENTEQRITMNSIFAIYFDKDNYVWLGTVKELLYSKNNKIIFYPYYQSEDYKTRIAHAYFIYPKTDSFLYVCAADGLYTIDIKTNKFNKLDSNKAFFFFYEFKDYFFVTNEKGFYIYRPADNKMIAPWLVYKELTVLKDELINSIIAVGDSALLLGSETGNGIYIWNYKNHLISNFNSRNTAGMIGNDIVNTMHQTSNGEVWILSDNQIVIYNPFEKTFRPVKWHNKEGQLFSIYFDMCETKEFYWLAVYGTGILQVDKQLKIRNIIGTGNGLANSGVYKIIQSKDAALYVSTNNGVYLLNTQNLTCKSYFESDGLNSSAFEGWCGFQRNNFIYFGGDKGLTVINTSENQKNNPVPPKIFINHSRIETASGIIDTSNLAIRFIEVPNDYSQATIYFSGINYSNPGRTTFAYKITELQNNWINLSAQNFVSLIGIAPGIYHLQVKAANEDGIWCEPKELVLKFLPKWYQTWWFKLLALTVICSIVFAFYRYRIWQIKKQHEIRKNIATDLHDDLGSTLNSVKVFTNLAINGVEQESSLLQVKDNLEQATMGLRDMIWVLDDTLDTVDELVTRLKQYAIPITTASGIHAAIKAEFDASKKYLTKDEKRNLFLLCKEAVNNSIKYSGANKIDILIEPDGKKIKITIEDNGKGFDLEKVRKGYGLKNMQYRAGQIKYKVDLHSIEDNGTKIIITSA